MSNFTPAEHANLVAGKVVAHATSFLEGRSDAISLGRHAKSVMIELLAAPDDAKAKAILDPARLLVVAMMGTSWADCEARRARWAQVMASLVALVRHESRALIEAAPAATAEA